MGPATFRKEQHNLAAALACKMLVALWHALMGHPVPGCEAERVHVHKVAQAARYLEKEHLARLGHANAMAFAFAVTRNLYAHLRTMDTKGIPSDNESPQIQSLEEESPIEA